MYSKKDLILDNLNMKDILREYGIETNRDMFCCPFHNDESPSAKCYKKSFYCFACGEGGDLIQFVQNLFNIDFITAMQKLNEDFNLGITLNKKIDKETLNKMKIQRLLKKLETENQIRQHRSEMIKLCNLEKALKTTYKYLKENINPYNWEETEFVCSVILQELEELDEKFELLNTKKRH